MGAALFEWVLFFSHWCYCYFFMVMLFLSHGVATLVVFMLFISHWRSFFALVLLFFLCGLVVFIAYVLLFLSHSSCYFSHILLLFFSCWFCCSSRMVLLLFPCCAVSLFALCYCSFRMVFLIFLHWCSNTFWPNHWLLLFLCWWCSYFLGVSLVFSPFYPMQLGAWSIKLTNKPLRWVFFFTLFCFSFF